MMSSSQLAMAPWNEKENTPIAVDCTVCYCMSKSMPVEIENYNTELVDDNLHEDNLVPEYSFEDTNFIEEYKNDNKALGIPTLLQELQRLSEERIEQLRTEGLMLDENDKEGEKRILKQIKYYQAINKASKNWVVDDLDVCQDE